MSTTPIHSATTAPLRIVPSTLKNAESSSVPSWVVHVANTPIGNVKLSKDQLCFIAREGGKTPYPHQPMLNFMFSCSRRLITVNTATTSQNRPNPHKTSTSLRGVVSRYLHKQCRGRTVSILHIPRSLSHRDQIVSMCWCRASWCRDLERRWTGGEARSRPEEVSVMGVRKEEGDLPGRTARGGETSRR